MFHGRQFIRAMMLVAVSYNLHAAPQDTDALNSPQFVAPMTQAFDYSTWLMLVAGVVGVVIARKRT